MNDLLPATTQEPQINLELLAASSVVPKAYQGKHADIYTAILMGSEFGWGPMKSLRSIHVIQGMPTIKTENQLGLVRERGHSVRFDFTDNSVTAHGQRADTGDTHSVTFSIADAERAGLTRNPTWKNYPLVMCQWRATGQLCRALFSDVISGMLAPDEAIEVGAARPNEQPPPTGGQPPFDLAAAKQRLVDACDGDVERARTVWADWETEHGAPTNYHDLDQLVSHALVVDAEIVEPEEQPLVEANSETD